MGWLVALPIISQHAISIALRAGVESMPGWVVMSRRIDPLPQFFNVERILANDKLLAQVVEQTNLCIELLGTARRPFSQPEVKRLLPRVHPSRWQYITNQLDLQMVSEYSKLRLLSYDRQQNIEDFTMAERKNLATGYVIDMLMKVRYIPFTFKIRWHMRMVYE